MTSNNRAPDFTRREALAPIAAGLIALPAAAQFLTEQGVATTTDAATPASTDTKPVLFTF